MSKRTRSTTPTATAPSASSTPKTDHLRVVREASAAAAPSSSPATTTSAVSAPTATTTSAVSAPTATTTSAVSAPTASAPKRKLCTPHKFAVQSRRMVRSLDKLVMRMRAWSFTVPTEGDPGAPADVFAEARTQLNVASKAIVTAARALERVPATWKPTHHWAAPAESAIVVGARVALRAKHRAAYEGLVSADELALLEVVSIGKDRVAVRSALGARLFFDRRHLMLAAAESAPHAEVPAGGAA